ncbi:MAG: hypothetical protein HY926_07725 [Elusimicrobia bacterium]|nr:hypothetical protein [Elusimicrobiota bacterium]
MSTPAASLLLCATLAVPAGAAVPSTATLRGVDVYRSETVTPDMVTRLLGQKIALFVLRSNEGGTALKFANQLKGELAADVSRLGDLAFVDMHVGRSIRAAAYDLVITFDLVDAKDRLARMPFAAPPVGRLPDPGGLLGQWRRYWELCAQARSRGEPVSERPACPSFYCPWIERTDAIRELEELFVREVPSRQAELARVLSGDERAQDRAAAVYLLAFSTSAPAVAERMLGALADPDKEVRVAALSVLADLVVYGGEVAIDVPRLLPALDYPTTEDRTKALAVFAGLAVHPNYKTYVAGRAAVQIARLLRSRDPGVRGLAHSVLGMVSGRDYPDDDFESWEKWAREEAAAAR